RRRRATDRARRRSGEGARAPERAEGAAHSPDRCGRRDDRQVAPPTVRRACHWTRIVATSLQGVVTPWMVMLTRTPTTVSSGSPVRSVLPLLVVGALWKVFDPSSVYSHPKNLFACGCFAPAPIRSFTFASHTTLPGCGPFR